jgi:hypothetical protein
MLFPLCARPQHAALAQAGDLLGALAELTQDLLAVLARLRRHAARLRRRVREVHRRGGQQRRARTIRHLDEAAGGLHLRIGQHLFQGLYRGPPQLFLLVEDLAPLLPRLRDEDLVQHADQLRSIGGPAAQIGKARVFDPLRVPHGPRQVRPVTLSLETDDPEPLAFAVLVVVDDRVEHRLAIPQLDVQPEAKADGEIEAQEVDALSQQ